eukprot:6200729-Pleurochrysis_carterae.AAC.1
MNTAYSIQYRFCHGFGIDYSKPPPHNGLFHVGMKPVHHVELHTSDLRWDPIFTSSMAETALHYSCRTATLCTAVSVAYKLAMHPLSTPDASQDSPTRIY